MDDVDGHPRLAAEQHARVLIDHQLAAAGWLVQDRKQLNLFAGDGVVVRETIMAPGHGRADYLLYVDKRAVGVIEAKRGNPTFRRRVAVSQVCAGASRRGTASGVNGRQPAAVRFRSVRIRDSLHQRV
jgi:type I site-specific restriction endonuclease